MMNSEMAYKLIDHIHFLTSIELSINETYLAYQKSTYDIMAQWNLFFAKFDECNNKWMKIINIDHPYNELKIEINKIIQLWVNGNPNGSLYLNTVNNCIIPIKSIF
jgi:hypothetical protein